MKKKDLQKMLGMIDESILSEADPTRSRKKAPTFKTWMKIVSIAACFLLVFNITILPSIGLMGNAAVMLGLGLRDKNKIGRASCRERVFRPV